MSDYRIPAPGTQVAWLIVYGRHEQDKMVILADEARADGYAASMHGIKLPLVVGAAPAIQAKEWEPSDNGPCWPFPTTLAD